MYYFPNYVSRFLALLLKVIRLNVYADHSRLLNGGWMQSVFEPTSLPLPGNVVFFTVAFAPLS